MHLMPQSVIGVQQQVHHGQVRLFCMPAAARTVQWMHWLFKGRTCYFVVQAACCTPTQALKRKSHGKNHSDKVFVNILSD